MSLVTLIGFGAATLTTISFLPQVIKIWKSRQADDLSPLSFGIFCGGLILWLVYGIILQDLPIIFANIITLSLAIAILVMTILFRKSPSGKASE
ncbi:MAG TPA: SemiSWEET transporter [Calditrichia bacterium]|nr:SemiSWEET transporter [Calditrichota bacterium]HQU71130.1 SemiSWEET transporter [Calditrichia bacterium]HQV32542.1 SemiSWEET transporter [Calditrichia bacterium]